jgi:hypothetical protein
MAFMDKLGRFLEGAVGGFQEGVNLRQGMNREQRAVDAVAENRRRYEMSQIEKQGAVDPEGALARTKILESSGALDPYSAEQASSLITGGVSQAAKKADAATAGIQSFDMEKQTFQTEQDVTDQLEASEIREQALLTSLATFSGVGPEGSASRIAEGKLQASLAREVEYQEELQDMSKAFTDFFAVPNLTDKTDDQGYAVGQNPLLYDQSLETIQKRLLNISKGNTELVEHQLRKIIDARNILDETRFRADVEKIRTLDPNAPVDKFRRLISTAMLSRNPVLQNIMGAVAGNVADITDEREFAAITTIGEGVATASTLPNLKSAMTYFSEIVNRTGNLPANFDRSKWEDMIKRNFILKQDVTFKRFQGEVQAMKENDIATAANYGTQKSSLLQSMARSLAPGNSRMSVLAGKNPLKWNNADLAMLAHAMRNQALDVAADEQINEYKDPGAYDARAILEGIPEMFKNIHGDNINRGRKMFFEGHKNARPAIKALREDIMPQAQKLFGNDEVALSMVNDALKEAGVKIDFNDPTGVGIVPLEDLAEQEEFRQQQMSQNPRAYVSSQAQSGSTLPPIFPEQVEAQ